MDRDTEEFKPNPVNAEIKSAYDTS